MNYSKDSRVVMTLDAGGTNFVFSAIQANHEIIDPICLPSNAHDLDLCLATISDGFRQVGAKLKTYPVAISFAFPGPTDYVNGIVGDLNNLPAFRGGVPLGPYLEEKFNIPVFLNNDGDLFVYGEAIAGLLPFVNSKLQEIGMNRRYNNLFGVTLGTGFGGGIVRNGELFIGDNSAAGEIWVMRNKKYNTFAEESISIRAVVREYKKHCRFKHDGTLVPKDIYAIAKGTAEGDKTAALNSFRELGEVLGDCIANAITLVDGIVVVGGGLSASSDILFPHVLNELNSNFASLDGNPVPRLEMKAFNLDSEPELSAFLVGSTREIKVPGSNRSVTYDPMKRIGVGISRLGTSKAVSIGAYAYALHRLDKHS